MLTQKNSVTQGNVGIGQAIAWATIRGYGVSIPLNDAQDYDLIFDIDGELKKVQVKTTTYKHRTSTSFSVDLRSKYGSGNGKTSKDFTSNTCDYVFVLTADNEIYFIPRCEITQTSMISMSVFGEHKQL